MGEAPIEVAKIEGHLEWMEIGAPTPTPFISPAWLTSSTLIVSKNLRAAAELLKGFLPPTKRQHLVGQDVQSQLIDALGLLVRVRSF